MKGGLAFFITPHGFGHAARACAVIEALWAWRSDLPVHLFTTVPQWFFQESLRQPIGYHPCPCDVGLVQATSLEEDLAATALLLREALPYPAEQVDGLAATVRALGCRAVVCDVSALGVVVAKRAGLPAVLVENFTWDWIYRAYAEVHPAFAEAAAYLSEVLAGAAGRIQCEPVCAPVAGARSVPPVWRPPRRSAAQVRRYLGVQEGRPVVLVTMGGIPWRWKNLEQLAASTDIFWVVPGGAEVAERHGNLLLLPHRTGLYHPDLVGAADLVAGKLGYSTVAEVVGLGRWFAYVPRPRFPESPVLEAFLQARGACSAISGGRLIAGSWVREVAALAAGPVPRPAPFPNGATAVAEEIRGLGPLYAMISQ